MLLILVLALLFCPSLAEGRVRGRKTKKDPGWAYYMERVNHLRKIKNRKKKEKEEKVRTFYFDKRPTPKFHSFGSAIPIMIFLPPEGKALPFLAGCGRGGIRTPDTVVRSHVL